MKKFSIALAATTTLLAANTYAADTISTLDAVKERGYVKLCNW